MFQQRDRYDQNNCFLLGFFYLVGLHYPSHFDFPKIKVATKLSVPLYHWTMNEHLVPFGAKFNIYIFDYWTFSHIMCLKSHWISGTKNTFDKRMNNWYVLGPSSIFFSDSHALKLLKWNVIQQIKKCGLIGKQDIHQEWTGIPKVKLDPSAEHLLCIRWWRDHRSCRVSLHKWWSVWLWMWRLDWYSVNVSAPFLFRGVALICTLHVESVKLKQNSFLYCWHWSTVSCFVNIGYCYPKVWQK